MGGRKHYGSPAVLLFGVLALSGCQEAPAAIFRPESPGATAIHDLSLILLAISIVVLVGIEATLFIAIFRFRNRPESEVVQTHGNLRLEIGWTAATALAVFAVLGLTVKTMADSSYMPASAFPGNSAWPNDTIPMRVVGYQWWWQFEYPQMNLVTANEVHVPEGKPMRVQVESVDVIHSFWVPRLGGKVDMIPGRINYTSFVATQPGVYEGECAEFCGTQHARMGFKVVVVSASEFSNWVRAQQAPAASPTTEAERAGEAAFLRSCGGCHTVNGTQAGGKSGPDLTHVGSRLTLAANTVPNTPREMARWLRDPQEVKPGNLMPKSQLDAATIGQLVAYLEGLK